MWPIIYYVKGTGKNKAKVIWMVNYTYGTMGLGKNPTAGKTLIAYGLPRNGSCNVVYDSDRIWPELKINDGEVKILFESTCWCDTTSPSPSIFGLRFVVPRKQFAYGSFYPFLTSVVIFTPKPGLFDENVPN
jgi:hypothetical protein